MKILARDSLLAIERPVVVLPFFTLFLPMFPLIITLIKAKKCLNSRKHVASTPLLFVTVYIAVSCLPLFLRRERFSIVTL